MTICISNLDDHIDDEMLRRIFNCYGEVKFAEIIKDVFTHISNSIAYVEMEENDAQKAIKALDQTVWNGLTITVKEVAQEQHQKVKVSSGFINPYRFTKN